MLPNDVIIVNERVTNLEEYVLGKRFYNYEYEKHKEFLDKIKDLLIENKIEIEDYTDVDNFVYIVDDYILPNLEEGSEELKIIESKITYKKTNDLLLSKKQIILYGPPGTGKTWEARNIAVRMLKEDGNISELKNEIRDMLKKNTWVESDSSRYLADKYHFTQQQVAGFKAHINKKEILGKIWIEKGD